MPEATLASVRLGITIEAAIERVFDAWLNPSVASHFLAAGDSAVSAVSIDPCVGGSFRIVMQGADGAYEHTGRYVQIERPHHLVFTWTSPATSGESSLVTIGFRSVDGATRVDLLHEKLPPDRADAHSRGWISVLRKLATFASEEVVER